MATRTRFEGRIRFLGLAAMLLCGLGTVVGMAVVIFRIPSVATTRVELLFGTLQGVAVSLLFAIAALLINLTLMLRRATHETAVGPWSGRA